MLYVDATCPLVTKVHVEARKFAAEGYTIVLIGHAGHEEVEGTMGEAPGSIVLVETEEDVDRLQVPDPDRVAYVSQTTLSVDETRSIINRLREKFPGITNSLLTLDSNFRLPLYREYVFSMGVLSVSKESITNILTRGGRNGEGMGRAGLEPARIRL